jgi:hypothetical protein
MVTGYTTQRRFKEPIEAEKKSLSICGNAPRVVIKGGLMTRQDFKKLLKKMTKEQVINLFASQVKEIQDMSSDGTKAVILYEWFQF